MADKIIIDITTKDNASKIISGIGTAVVSLNQGLELMKKAASAAAAPFASVLAEGMGFSKQMSIISATSKDAEQNIAALTAEAERIGAATEFSATQAAGAMDELAKSGMTSAQILNTTASAMALASATGADLSRSAGVMAVQLNQFSKEGLTAQKAADLIVKTVSASPQTFEDLASALERSSGTASAFGIKFETLTQILGAMGDAGVRAEIAGTALNAALAKLANPTSEAKEALQELGLTTEQVSPLTNDFDVILGRLHDSGANASQILRVLGQEAGPKFIKVIEQGGDVLKNFKKKQDEANSASEVQQKRLNNLSGDWEKFNSAISGLKLDVFKLLDPMLRNVTKSATSMIDDIQKFFKKNINNMADFVEGLAITVKGINDFFSDFGKKNKETFDGMWKTIKEIFDKIITALEEFWKRNKETFEAIAKVVVSITSKFLTLASKILDIVMPALIPLGGLFLSLIKNILELIDKALDPLIAVLDRVVIALKFVDDFFTNSTFFGAKGAKQRSEFERSIMRWWKNFDLLKDSGNAAKTSMENFANAGIESSKKSESFAFLKMLRAFREISDWWGTSGDSAKVFSDALDDTTKAAAALEDKLVIHSVSDALFTIAGQLRALGREDAPEATKGIDAVTASAEAAEAALNTAADAAGIFGTSLPGTPGNPIGLGEMIIGEGGVAQAQASGLQVAGQVTGVSAGIQAGQAGGPWAALIAVLTDFLLQNETFKTFIATLNKTLGEVLAPVLESLVIILEPLIPLIQALAPLLKTTGAALGLLTGRLATWIQVVTHWVETTTEAINKLPEKLFMIFEKLKEILSEALKIALAVAVAPLVAALIPLKILADFLKDNFGAEITAIGNDFQTGIDKFKADVQNFIDGVKTTLEPVKTAIESLAKNVTIIFEYLRDILSVALQGIVDALTPLKNKIIELFEFIRDTFKPVLETLGKIVYGLANILSSLLTAFTGPNGLFANLTNAITDLITPIKDLRDKIVDLIEKFKGGAGKTGEKIKDIVTGVAGKIGVPGYASGGLITANRMLKMPGMASDAGLILAHEGETVIPKGGRLASSGTPITINVVALNPREQAEQIRVLLEEMFLTGRLRVA